MNCQLLENLGLTGVDISIILIIMLIIIIVSLAVAIIALMKYTTLNNKYKRFMGGNDAKALESYITELIEINKTNEVKIQENRAEIQVIAAEQKRSFQKMGIVKYDALKEMGGNLSFALAVLDNNNNGFIINSVQNIQTSYCYSKEIKNGTSSITLSKEESAALEKALTS